MRPEAFRELSRKRATRARELARRRSEAAEALLFFAHVASFQAEVSPAAPLSFGRGLVDLVVARAPAPLAEVARTMGEKELESALARYQAREDLLPEEGFFARVLLQPSMAVRDLASRPSEGGRLCPFCAHPPQTGCLRRLGDGTDLSLSCSLCLREWRFPRGACIGCGNEDSETLGFYEASEIPQLRLATCDRCRRYLHVVRLDADPEAIPDADEIAGLSLDLWARERGFEKLIPNLVGI